MASLYLGKIGNSENAYEIHALTNNLPFREYNQSEISDSNLFNEILNCRFELLNTNRPIYCTAINPDLKNKKEANPHDFREGTVHFVAINKSGNISCGLSAAIDIGEKDKGTPIGLPLENRWKQNGFPEGQNLDLFRKKYLRINYNLNRSFKPGEMVELYRHFKSNNENKSFASRLGVYSACYHLLVREARKKQLTQSSYWVFDAIPEYFNLYKYTGSAVLRDFTIKTPIQLISPSKKRIRKERKNGQTKLFYGKINISRNVIVPIPYKKNGILSFRNRNIPFLDGIVDIFKCEKSVQHSPIKLNLKGITGYSLKDRINLRCGLSIIGRRIWDEDCLKNNIISKKINTFFQRKTGITKIIFNQIGSLTS